MARCSVCGDYVAVVMVEDGKDKCRLHAVSLQPDEVANSRFVHEITKPKPPTERKRKWTRT